jgi:hypothetical protein
VVSKAKWDFKPSTLAHLVAAVTKSTGLPVRTIEFNSQTKTIRVSVDPPAADKSVETRVPVVL